MKIRDAAATIVFCSAVLSAQTPAGNASTNKPQTNAKIGQTAPDFTLPSTTGGDITLSSYRGKKNVVLAFIVKAFTGG